MKNDCTEQLKPYRCLCVGPVVLGRTSEELLELATEDGQPAYRAKQLMDGILQGARSINDINNVRQIKDLIFCKQGLLFSF